MVWLIWVSSGHLASSGQVAGVVVGSALQDAGHKVVHGGGLVDPGLDHPLIAAAAHGAGNLAQQLGAVHRLDALLFGLAAVDGAVPVTGFHDGGVLLDDAEVQAVLGGEGGGAHAAVAGAHDDDIGVPGLGDGGLVDVGLGAQPVILVAGGQLNRSHHRLAHGLGKAALGGLHDGLGSVHDGLGSDGGTRHAVDLSRTGGQQLLLQLLGCGGAVGSSFTRGIHHHVGDSVLAEGHGDLDGGGNALGGALIGAGDVGGAGGHRACARSCAGCPRAGSLAGSQCAGGHAAHGGGSGDLQKAFAGNLFHDPNSFFSFLLRKTFLFRTDCGFLNNCSESRPDLQIIVFILHFRKT